SRELYVYFFFSSRRRHTRLVSDWSSDVCSSDLAVRALDVLTGEQRWEFKLHSPPWAGLLSTAGGLVFGGASEGNFFALDAQTGRSEERRVGKEWRSRWAR